LRDFTDGNIPSVYTEGITVGKKNKTKQKKIMTCQDLPMKLQRESLTDFVCRYFPESSTTVHFPIALLIVVLYGQNHRQIEKSSVLFGGFLKKFN
jgi:hypothetical protein